MTMTDVATLSVAAQPSHVGTCELCATDAVALTAAAVVRHSRGGAVQLVACDRCERAIRRLAAMLGSGPLVAGPAVVVTPPAPPASAEPWPIAIAPTPVPPASPAVANGPARLVAELTSELVGSDGRRWVARAYGEPRADGSWIGWLEFGAVDGSEVRRTAQETSQPNLNALTYWTNGLQPSFLEGAFKRAR